MRPSTTIVPLVLALILAACGAGSDEVPSAGDSCSLHLSPGEDDQVAVQSALLGAGPGSVVCFEAGTYHLHDGLALSAPGVTLRAEGGLAIFDFSQQSSPAAGLDVTGDDFSLEGIRFRRPRGPGLRILGADNVRLSRVEAELSLRRSTEQAAGLAILGASNVRIEDCELSGGPVGLSIRSSFQVVVSGCTLRGNRVGLSLQHASDVELVGNTLRSNDDGLHLLGSSEHPSERIKIHDNLIEHSRASRGQPPAELLGGAGLVLLGTSTVEIHDNVIRRNDGGGILLGGALIAAQLAQATDAGLQGPLFIHDNHVEMNGRRPAKVLRSLFDDKGADLLLEAGEADHPPCFSENQGSFLSTDGGELPPTGGCPSPRVAPISL